MGELMKIMIWGFLGALASFSAVGAPSRAVEVTLHGSGAFFDNGGWKVVRLVAGDLFAEGKVEKLIVRRSPIQSSDGFCLELRQEADASVLTSIISQLKKISPQGRYQVTQSPSCGEQAQ